MSSKVPVITVDGPSGGGKGTLSLMLAKKLGWHFLDSGALYRVLALAAIRHSVALDNHEALAVLAAHLDVIFKHDPQEILLEGQIVTMAIRTEECGGAASQVAAIPAVRTALLERQRAFLEAPGLVADGRDMGTVIFPAADLKIFLEATALERAKRRQLQLKQQGIDVSLDGLFVEIEKRDERDKQRSVSPLVPAHDAIVIDTTQMPIEKVFETVMAHVNERISIKT
ncbi:(d)CMP kinase [Candidatus Berkiella aquae]|uniref:Cytidylate kinase n=1 Tax=Candidatus Berkiella aquae TaxID=295108 RepID=A0A0Q9Z006_9GAMM|nr:(d)CMP kinase [Candidatus Berkiella aquae]MCS5712023.1 (d)CMP kinase [Candidatus Berkiella aquae]